MYCRMNTVQISKLFSILLLISCYSLSRMLSIIFNKAISVSTTITTKSFQSKSSRSSSSLVSCAFVVALSPWITRRIQNKPSTHDCARASQFAPKTTRSFATTVLTQRKRQLHSKSISSSLSSLLSSIDNTSEKCNDNFEISLRNATINDLQLLEYWDTKPHVVECTGEDDYNDDDDWNWEKELQRTVKWREQLIAEIVITTKNNTITNITRPIGIIQIIDPKLEESHYWGADFNESNVRAIDIWIGEEHDLGKGYEFDYTTMFFFY